MGILWMPPFICLFIRPSITLPPPKLPVVFYIWFLIKLQQMCSLSQFSNGNHMLNATGSMTYDAEKPRSSQSPTILLLATTLLMHCLSIKCPVSVQWQKNVIYFLLNYTAIGQPSLKRWCILQERCYQGGRARGVWPRRVQNSFYTNIVKLYIKSNVIKHRIQ